MSTRLPAGNQGGAWNGDAWRYLRAGPAKSAVVALCAASGFVVAALPGAVASAATREHALQVSFEPEASVRLRGQRFVGARAEDAAAANAVIKRYSGVRVERVAPSSEAAVDAKRGDLLRAGKRSVPDLNRHYRVFANDPADREQLLAELDALAVVDEAIREPKPPPPPATPDFRSQQRYGAAGPAGIDVAAVSALPGGQGQQAKIIDIEYSWNQAHEDLGSAASSAALIRNGTPSDPFSDSRHGTAVLGQLIGTDNAFGVTGLAPASPIGMVNAATTQGWRLPEAVTLAHQNLVAGDVMLVEQQFEKVGGARDYVPVEFVPAVYDAIRLATLDGIIVVEAAGNGGVDLDGSGSGSPFPQGRPDSGAIVVGAGSGDCGAPANRRLSFSTYGSRVNLQGWGQCVTTTGGSGDLFNGGSPDSTYTRSFSGTSSASAVVAAAAALYSSVLQAATGVPPSPRHVRSRLVATGTPEAVDSATHIGPLPDLRAAVTGYDATPPTTSVTSGPSGPTNDSTPMFEFSATEAGSTFECRVAGATAFTPCASPHTTAALPDGPRTFEVRATDAAFNTGPPATRAFTIDTVLPSVSISGGPSGRTSDPTPTFVFSSSEAGASFECRVGTALEPGRFAACSSPYAAVEQAAGERLFEVRATDTAGNTGPSASRAFVIDAPRAGVVRAPETSDLMTSPFSPPPAAPSITEARRVSARVSRAGWVQLQRPRVTCPSSPPACTVTAEAVLARGGGSRRAGAAAGRSRIGGVSFDLEPGRSARLRFKLTKKAQKSLGRRGQLRATVTITARHGMQVSVRTLRVKLTSKRR